LFKDILFVISVNENEVVQNGIQRPGLCAAGEYYFRQPRLTDDENRNKC